MKSTEANHPEFIQLPKSGGDPVCNMSQSWWRLAESKGLIRLVRPRLPGRQRAGRVLLPVAQAIALIERLNGPAAVEAEAK